MQICAGSDLCKNGNTFIGYKPECFDAETNLFFFKRLFNLKQNQPFRYKWEHLHSLMGRNM